MFPNNCLLLKLVDQTARADCFFLSSISIKVFLNQYITVFDVKSIQTIFLKRLFYCKKICYYDTYKFNLFLYNR